MNEFNAISFSDFFFDAVAAISLVDNLSMILRTNFCERYLIPTIFG